MSWFLVFLYEIKNNPLYGDHILPPSVRDLLSATNFYWMFMKLGVGLLYNKASEEHELRENRPCDSHAVPENVKELLLSSPYF